MSYSPVLVSALGNVIVVIPNEDGSRYGVFLCNRNGNWESGSWYNSLKEANDRRKSLFKLHRKIAKTKEK